MAQETPQPLRHDAASASPLGRGATWKQSAWIAGIAVCFPVASYVSTGHVGLNLLDEGFLWYGVVQTAAGEVPLRDFQAYDPGRYYWGALGAWLFGTGILDLRLSLTLFQILGLLCGLRVASRVTRNPWLLVAIGGLLTFWMFPRHKIFESALAMMATWIAVRLLEAPSPHRFLTSGIFAGVAAVFGRNHGLYAACALLVLILLLHWKEARRGLMGALGRFGAGIAIGYAPVLIMLVLMPEFAERFFESIRFVIERGNLPEPIPWPWTLDYAQIPSTTLPFILSISLFYMLLVALPPGALALSCYSGARELSQRRVLVAGATVSLFYAHHAFSRAGPDHLAQSLHPLLLALIAVPAAVPAARRAVAISVALLLAGTLAVSAPYQPELEGLLWRDTPLVAYDAAGDTLLLAAEKARGLTRLEDVVHARIRPDEPLFIAPFDVGLYPLLGRRSPTWEIYMLWRATEREEERMIGELERGGVDWALISDQEIRGHPGTFFPTSHPRVWDHLVERFIRVAWSRADDPAFRAPRSRSRGDVADPLSLPESYSLHRRIERTSGAGGGG